jgi:hypothetical protein
VSEVWLVNLPLHRVNSLKNTYIFCPAAVINPAVFRTHDSQGCVNDTSSDSRPTGVDGSDGGVDILLQENLG